MRLTPWLKALRARLRSPRGRVRRNADAPVAAVVQTLESRVLLSGAGFSIDGFVFGGVVEESSVTVDYKKTSDGGELNLDVNGNVVDIETPLADGASTGLEPLSNDGQVELVDADTGLKVDVTATGDDGNVVPVRPKDRGLGIQDDDEAGRNSRTRINGDEALLVEVADGGTATGGTLEIVGGGTARATFLLDGAEVATLEATGPTISLDGQADFFDAVSISAASGEIGFDSVGFDVSPVVTRTVELDYNKASTGELLLSVDGEVVDEATPLATGASTGHEQLLNDGEFTLVDVTSGIEISVSATGDDGLTEPVRPKDRGLGIQDDDEAGKNTRTTINGDEALLVQIGPAGSTTKATGGQLEIRGSGTAEVVFLLDGVEVGSLLATGPSISLDGQVALFDAVRISAASGSIAFDGVSLDTITADFGTIAFGQVGNKNRWGLENSLDSSDDGQVGVRQNRAIEDFIPADSPVLIRALDSEDTGRRSEFEDRTWWDRGEGLGIRDGNDSGSSNKFIDGDEILEISLNGYLASSIDLDIAKVQGGRTATTTVYVTFVRDGQIVDSVSVDEVSRMTDPKLHSAALFDAVLISANPVTGGNGEFVTAT